jgi:hypothetical protein
MNSGDPFDASSQQLDAALSGILTELGQHQFRSLAGCR